MVRSTPTLSIAIPALNESDIILGNVQELKAFMSESLPQIEYEIVVINDGSTDGMDELLEKHSAEDPQLRVFHHPQNMGRGRAVRTAMSLTESDYLIVLDADLSYGPDHIPLLLEPLQDGKADLTLASAYHRDGIVENVPVSRAILSRIGNIILSSSFRADIKTVTCVVRGYTRELMDHLELINDGKDLHLELLYKTEILGFTIKEVPASLIWRERKRGQSKKQGFSAIFDSPLFKMRRIIISHFLFNFFTKPKLLFALPLILGMLLAGYGTFSLIGSYLFKLTSGVSQPLRQTLLDGQLTLNMTMASIVLSLIFVFFFFISTQLKQYFEEQYILSTRNHYLLKQLKRQLDKRKE